jgi:hypothetical protein
MEVATVLIAALFGAFIAVLAPMVRTWITRRVTHRLEIRLPSGGRLEISGDARASSADLNKLINSILLSDAKGDQKALESIASREHSLASLYDRVERATDRESSVSDDLDLDFQILMLQNPLDKRIAILFGRYVARRGDIASLKKAIEILSTFVQAKREADQLDQDYADGLYNRACYRARIINLLPELQAQGQGVDDAEGVREAILSDLRESLRVSPQNALDAARDIDFAPVQNDSAYQELISRYTRAS